MKIDWQHMDTVPEGERVFLLLKEGEKGNGELAIGMVYRYGGESINCYWTWGGGNAGSDIDEVPIAWAPLPEWEHGL